MIEGILTTIFYYKEVVRGIVVDTNVILGRDDKNMSIINSFRLFNEVYIGDEVDFKPLGDKGVAIFS